MPLRSRFLLPLFLAFALACEGSPPPPYDPLKPLQPAAAVADVAAFRRAVEEGHAALYRYRTREQIDRKFAELETAAQKGPTTAELWRHLSEFAAFVADAHLQIHPSQPIYDRIFRENLLPISIAFRGDRCEVVESLTAAIPNGSEVLSIGGLACREIPESFERLIPSDGRTTARKRHVLERDFPIFLAMTSGFARKFPIEIRAVPGTEPAPMTIDTMSYQRKQALRGDSAAARAPQPFAHSLTFVDGETAVMKVVSFEKERKNRLPAFLERAFADLHQRGTKNLVIDLRGNGGGRDAYAALLFSYIATGPFRYVGERVVNAKSFAFLKDTDDRWLNLMTRFIDKKQRADGKWVLDEELDREQQPQKRPFTGRVVLLQDASSFSTSSEFASLFRSAGRGLIAGEESGNAYGGDSGADVTLNLPNSGLAANIPLVEYRLAVRPLQPLDAGVLPDCAIERRFADRFTGRDSMLPAAVEAARSGRCAAVAPPP
jgi:hypothetical protein